MSQKKSPHTYGPRTRLIHGSFHSPHWDYHDHIIPPITASTAYRLESAERGAKGFTNFANPEFNRETQQPIYIYDRLDEPSRGMLEHNLASAEGGECAIAFATGMAAISAACGVLMKQGDKLLFHRTIYGCSYSLFSNWFPRLGWKAEAVDLRDPAALKSQLSSNTMVLFFETPCNPTLELIDIQAVRRIVDEANKKRTGQKRKLFIVVDNTFATPFGQRPLELGADLVVESLTKNIGGFGTDMGGAVIGPKLLEPDLLLYRKDFGGSLSPKNAWPVLVYGLPTLPARVRIQQDSAMEIAGFLECHPHVQKVHYPGLPSYPERELARRQMRDSYGNFAPGTLIYFVLDGEGEEAQQRGAKFINHLAHHALSITLAVSLGQIRTLVEHPSSMTHAAIPIPEQIRGGIDPGGLRLSIGLEDPADVISDLSEALKAACAT